LIRRKGAEIPENPGNPLPFQEMELQIEFLRRPAADAPTKPDEIKPCRGRALASIRRIRRQAPKNPTHFVKALL
jgi:hypothetical protein